MEGWRDGGERIHHRGAEGAKGVSGLEFGVRGLQGVCRFARNGALASCGLAKGAGITFRTLGGTASVPSQISKAGGSPVAVRGFAAALNRTFKPRGLFSAGSSEICPYRAWIWHRAKIPRENHTSDHRGLHAKLCSGSQGVQGSSFTVSRFAVVPFKIRSDLCALCASVVSPPFREFGVWGLQGVRRSPEMGSCFVQEIVRLG
jgi:hypothetical protein